MTLDEQAELREHFKNPKREGRKAPVKRRISAERIAAILLDTGLILSQSELAERLGVGRRSIQTWLGKTAEGVQVNRERLRDLKVIVDRGPDARENYWFHESVLGEEPAAPAVEEPAWVEEEAEPAFASAAEARRVERQQPVVNSPFDVVGRPV